jgi:hypothetical protein
VDVLAGVAEVDDLGGLRELGTQPALTKNPYESDVHPKYGAESRNVRGVA